MSHDVNAQVSYRRLLTDRTVLLLLATVTTARFASGLVPFGLVALFTDRDDLLWAGISSSAFLVSAALTGPVKGRLIDRRGPQSLIVPMALLFFVGAVSAAILGFNGYAAAAVVLGALAAAASPPNSAVLRSVWNQQATSDAHNRRLHSLDAVVEETTFVMTPLITAGIWLFASPAWAVALGGVCCLCGTVAFRAVLRNLSFTMSVPEASPEPAGPPPVSLTQEHEAPQDGVDSADGVAKSRALLSINALSILLPMAALGIAMGCYAVWYPAWGLSLGHPQWAGVAEALMSVAGVLGVFLYEKFVTPAGRTSLHYLGMGLILMASLVLAALSTGIGIILLTSILAGLALTPMNVASYVLVNEKIPAGQHTEVNAAIGSAYNLGSGACALLVGIAFSTFSLRYVVVAVTLIITPLVGAALLGRPIARPAPELVGAQQDGATAQ